MSHAREPTGPTPHDSSHGERAEKRTKANTVSDAREPPTNTPPADTTGECATTRPTTGIVSDRRTRLTLEPLDAHEVRVVAVMTGLWVIALVVLIIVRESLPPDQRWWVWTCVAGVTGGIVALGYVYQRRRGIEKRQRRGR